MRTIQTIWLLGILAACQSSGPEGIPHGCPNWPNESGELHPIKTVKPRHRARKADCVEIQAKIDRTGAVSSAHVVKSTNPGGPFDAAALRAYRRWRYCPLEEGVPDYPPSTTVKICCQPQ